MLQKAQKGFICITSALFSYQQLTACKAQQDLPCADEMHFLLYAESDLRIRQKTQLKVIDFSSTVFALWY